MRSVRGLSAIEMLVALTLALIVAAATLPALGRMRKTALVAAGTRHVATALHAARWKSVALGRSHGLYFVEQRAGWSWLDVRDGNGNGLKTAEVLAGTDPVLSGPHRLERIASGVTFGFPPDGPFPRIPPAGGTLDASDDPVRFGNTRLVAFSPMGTASSGSLYVTDRHRLWAVVVYGQTAKIRVWRFVRAKGRWT